MLKFGLLYLATLPFGSVASPVVKKRKAGDALAPETLPPALRGKDEGRRREKYGHMVFPKSVEEISNGAKVDEKFQKK